MNNGHITTSSAKLLYKYINFVKKLMINKNNHEI